MAEVNQNAPIKSSMLNNGIGQIAFVVKDLDQTVKNYWEKFGIGPWHFYTYGQAPTDFTYSEYQGEPAHFKMRIALSYFGPTRIELIEHAEGNTIYKDFLDKHGEGVQHLGIVVENMEKALEDALAAGFKIAMQGAGFGPDRDGRFVYLSTEDEFGTTYELIERPQKRHKPEKIYPPEFESEA